MIALGWAGPGVLPHGLNSAAAGPLRLVSVAKGQAETPRARSAWQVRCIEAGIDFLPLSPHRAVSTDEAARLPKEALCAAFDAVSGHVQMTLSAPCPSRGHASSAGRVWLQERAREEQVRRQTATALRHCVEKAGLRITPMRWAGGAAFCDILVPRAQTPDLAADLRRAFSTDVAWPRGLTLCGPWPAYAFANLPQEALV